MRLAGACWRVREGTKAGRPAQCGALYLFIMLIGVVGQGFVGGNLADELVSRGQDVVRYSLDPSHLDNKDKIKDCDIVFIAVPAPTTPTGFDSSIIYDSLALVGSGKIAVIKSTTPPGTTKALQMRYPGAIVLHAPEFLSEVTAAEDTAHPFINIIGMAVVDDAHRAAACKVMRILPSAPANNICTSTESEITKYAHNCSGVTQIVFFNMMYDLAMAHGASWEAIQHSLMADPLIPHRYSRPIHKSGRGAGGHCFPKDFAAFVEAYTAALPDDHTGAAALVATEVKNYELLIASGKDADLLKGIYGGEPPTRRN